MYFESSDNKNMNIEYTKRHNARCHAMQALYQLEFRCNSAQDIFNTISKSPEFIHVDQHYFQTLFLQTSEKLTDIDALLRPALDREVTALNPVELAILRLAIYEMQFCPETPYRVIINESVEIAKNYGATQGYKYINGVLDTLAKQLRTIEFNSDPSK